MDQHAFWVDFGREPQRFPAWTPDVLHAWAMTIHKYQGSEIPHAIVVMEKRSGYQSREELYTAATRGSKSVTIHSDGGKLSAALGRSSRAERLTMLRERLSSALAKRKRDA